MDEKILIKSQKYNVKKLFKTFLKFWLLLSAIAIVLYFVISGKRFSFSGIKMLYEYDSEFANYYMVKHIGKPIVYCVLPIVPITLIGGLIYFLLGSCELTITNKRVYGKTVWGQRVDLPIDSVSAVGIGIFKSITVSTSSGRINFLAIKNRNEIHNVVSNLLVERQKQNVTTMQTTVSAYATSTADEIKKYKELLDLGIITQEEFDAKKKQLLGL